MYFSYWPEYGEEPHVDSDGTVYFFRETLSALDPFILLAQGWGLPPFIGYSPPMHASQISALMKETRAALGDPDWQVHVSYTWQAIPAGNE